MHTRTYWKLNAEQEKALSGWIRYSTVYDLGAGDMNLSRYMALFARHVHAIDKDLAEPYKLPKNVTCYPTTFQKFKAPKTIDCAVISWPPNYNCLELIELVKMASRVVYIGKNTDGTACGTPALFLHLTRRRLAVEVRSEHNCLHCYGAVESEEPQFRSEEEVCGLITRGPFRILHDGGLLADPLALARSVAEIPA